MTSKTTQTFITRNADGSILADRTSATMNYTHAVLATDDKGQEPGIFSWHTTEDLARKAAANLNSHPGSITGKFSVVPVEAHQGSKAKVLKALAAEAIQDQPKPSKATRIQAIQDRAEKANETETSTAKKAPAPAKEKAPKAYTVPTGYEVKYPHGGYDLLRKVNAKTEGPAWWVTCNAHGNLTDADTAKAGDALGRKDSLAKWCKGDHKAAAPAPAKAPAAKATPAKAKAPRKPSAKDKANGRTGTARKAS